MQYYSRKLSALAALSQVLVLAFLSLNVASKAGIAQQALPNRPFSTRVIQSGHSLTDPIPEMLQRIVRATGFRGAVIDRSTIPGSTLDWRWAVAPEGEPDARADIKNYDLLITTERVPIIGAMEPHNSKQEALRWFENTWSHGNGGKGAEMVLYATWVHINSGPDHENQWDMEGHLTFRERLPLEMGRWEQVKDYVNRHRPAGSPKLQLIPGPLIMAEFFDRVSTGQAPDFQDISDIFIDDIHLNNKGSYMISLAHFMVIYGRDPRGLPYKVGQDDPPSLKQALWMQELVWDVVSDYISKNG